jgi:succinoglycan biosynthesis protein ExoM
MLVSVCICTFRRATVADAIRSVLAQQGIRRSSFEIVVCDDDPGLSARDTVEEFAADAPIAIRYVTSGSANVSVCRNKCLEFARGDWIAFIDDDEMAQPDWLHELIAVQQTFRADLVKGYVHAVYPDGGPDWIVNGDPFTRDSGKTGSRLGAFGAGNVMFRRSIAVEHGLTFDPAYGRTGGEDIDFFRRFADLDATIVACRSAIVKEIVQPERITASYLGRRERRDGYIFARVFYKRASRARRTLMFLRSAMSIAVCSPYPLARKFGHSKAYWLFAKFWVHVGVIEWTLGRPTPRLQDATSES